MKYQSAVFHGMGYDVIEKLCFDTIQEAVCGD